MILSFPLALRDGEQRPYGIDLSGGNFVTDVDF